jgi:hypothetical protein
MYSNFITPPDFVDEPLPTVLVIDADWNDVETLALYCQSAKDSYNVYLYSDIMMEEEWLRKAIDVAHVIILNSAESACTKIKNQLIKDPRTWYYGPHKYLANPQRIESPIDFFNKNNERTT